MNAVVISERVRARVGERRLNVLKRFSKALVTAVCGTVLSQIVLLGLLTGHTNSTLASFLAFLAGAIPNYFISRRWAWGRDRKPHFRTETLPYVLVVATTGLLSTGLTTLTDHLLHPLAMSEFWRIVVLDGAFVGSYALMFVLKFTLLDRLVFRAAAQRPAGPGRTGTAGEERTPATTSPS
ncbi:GtrA family protein [Sciscionella marina]|uniref:GtrA family protein n=1 Tax=Sciscionella marina TaxID=508770 RepID=UPI000A063100|nr:GtrA family protein [Sciscionella marina]